MFYYLFIIIFLLFISSKRIFLFGVSLYSYGVKCQTIIFLFIALFLCTGYMTGSDWRGYEELYNEASWENFRYYRKEQLFYFLMLFFKKLSSNFFVFLIICKLFVFYVFLRFLNKYSQNIFLSYFFFIPLNALFLFIDNPLRFMIALCFVVLSYDYYLEKNLIKFIFLILLASLFHITALIFLPIYFIRNIKINRLFLSVLFLVWMFGFNNQQFMAVVQYFLGYSELLSRRMSSYMVTGEGFGSVFSIGLIIYVIFFFWIIANRQNILSTQKNGNIFYSMSIIYLFLTKFGILFPTAQRFGYFFAPFFIITITQLINLKKTITSKFISLFVGLYIILFTYKKIDEHYVYIPYSNYLTSFIKGELHDYNYRSNYNLEEFYIRKGYHRYQE